LGAGKPLAHQVSPKQLLGSGACGLLEIFLNQQICYWTGVLCTGRQLANARLVAAYILRFASNRLTSHRQNALGQNGGNESSFLEARCSRPHSFDRNTLCKFCAQIEKKGQALAQAKRVT
jgi:hypothetical protein